VNLDTLSELAISRLPRAAPGSPQSFVPIRNLTILRHQRPTSFEATIYDPVICLILQGRKETVLGAETYSMGAGDCLLISHDLPVTARITKAPYLALIVDLELEILRDLYDEIADALPPMTSSTALSVHRCDAALVDALARYLALTSSPTDVAVLGALVTREIHYRLTMAPFGNMLRNLIRHDSHASAIARAIAQLRRDFRTPIAMADLARNVGMSESAFYKHFKAVTSQSPLQYQKDLRLLEARRLLRAGSASVSTAAFDVGYESPTQFSREYARKFGASPRHDLPAVP
jgi:AraC-like DNA-binding protein